MYDFEKEYNSYYNKSGMFVEYKGQRYKAIRISYNETCILWKTSETYVLDKSGVKYLCNFYREYCFTYPNIPRTTNDMQSKMIKHNHVKIHESKQGNYIQVDGRRYYVGELNNYSFVQK